MTTLAFRSPRPSGVVTRPETVTPAAVAVHEMPVIVSIRTPAAPPATALESVATRHFIRTICPLAAAGRLTVVVIYAGAAVVPPERLLQASLPAIGLPKPTGMTWSYPPVTKLPPAAMMSWYGAPL